MCEGAPDKLQALRDRLGKPMIVRSACRSPEHNRAVGGAKASKHLEGIAFDIAMANHDPEAFKAARVLWLRLLPALRLHPCRPRSRPPVVPAVPDPGNSLRG